MGSVIHVSAGGRDRLNAMYMVDGYGENNPIVVKSEFIMSLIEQIDKKGVGSPSTNPSSTGVLRWFTGMPLFRHRSHLCTCGHHAGGRNRKAKQIARFLWNVHHRLSGHLRQAEQCRP